MVEMRDIWYSLDYLVTFILPYSENCRDLPCSQDQHLQLLDWEGITEKHYRCGLPVSIRIHGKYDRLYCFNLGIPVAVPLLWFKAIHLLPACRPCPKPGLIKGLRAHTDVGGIILLFQHDKKLPFREKHIVQQASIVENLENSGVLNNSLERKPSKCEEADRQRNAKYEQRREWRCEHSAATKSVSGGTKATAPPQFFLLRDVLTLVEEDGVKFLNPELLIPED
ncbi:hypothetical protein RIF29_15589 [Crotalaria pallida]|uniref:Uncharacterized protein n=1 Tax=Crotalaria pallida TaxID=3830 RepID=A0AAN9FDE3_CROPI